MSNPNRISKLSRKFGSQKDASVRADQPAISKRSMSDRSQQNALPMDRIQGEASDYFQMEHKKDEDTPLVLPCPICAKQFSSRNLRSSHLKLCAAKHGMPTEKLFEAVALQDRQAAERAALGLPVIKKIQDANKRVPNKIKRQHREYTACDDDIQMAMALSKSLKDAEDQWEDFVEDIPVVPNESKKLKSNNMHGITLLMRTEEERQAIVNKKVAELLTCQPLAKHTKSDHSNTLALSPSLSSCRSATSELWNSASNYAVVEKTCDEKKCTAVSDYSKSDEFAVNSSQSSGRSVKKGDSQLLDDLVEIINLDDENEKKKDEHESFMKLSTDWKNLLNNELMSDMTICLPRDKKVFVHKLVMLARCPDMLRSASESSELKWLDVPEAAAFAFLEYVYGGLLPSLYLSSSIQSAITELAVRYCVDDLVIQMRKCNSSVSEQQITEQFEDSCAGFLSQKSGTCQQKSSDCDDKMQKALCHYSPSDNKEVSDIFDDSFTGFLTQSQKETSILKTVSPANRNETLTSTSATFAPLHSDGCSTSQEERTRNTEYHQSPLKNSIFSRSCARAHSMKNSPYQKLHTRSSPLKHTSTITKTSPDCISILSDSDTPRKVIVEHNSRSSPSVDYLLSTGDSIFVTNDLLELCSTPCKELSGHDCGISSTPIRHAVLHDGVEKRVDKNMDAISPKSKHGKRNRKECRISSPETPVQCKKKRGNMAARDTENITPILDYSAMVTPELKVQLKKFGVKPMPRKRAKQLLRHIYEETHPVVDESYHSDEQESQDRKHLLQRQQCRQLPS